MKDTRPRNKEGKFVEDPNSLHPKSISFRVSKQNYPRLMALAESLNLRPGELVREVVEQYLAEHGVF